MSSYQCVFVLLTAAAASVVFADIIQLDCTGSGAEEVRGEGVCSGSSYYPDVEEGHPCSQPGSFCPNGATDKNFCCAAKICQGQQVFNTTNPGEPACDSNRLPTKYCPPPPEGKINNWCQGSNLYYCCENSMKECMTHGRLAPTKEGEMACMNGQPTEYCPPSTNSGSTWCHGAIINSTHCCDGMVF